MEYGIPLQEYLSSMVSSNVVRASGVLARLTLFPPPVVLAKKADAAENKNTKNYAQDKWDREVRESIAKKKAAATNGSLSKQEQTLVNAQLKEEANIREKLQLTKNRLDRGMSFVLSLVRSKAPSVSDNLLQLATLLQKSALTSGGFLVAERGFRVYLALGQLCPERIGFLRQFLGIATLRAQGVMGVPEDLSVEPLSGQ